MFISALDLFKVGIGPSSSHTMGPMIAASEFLQLCSQFSFDSQNDYKIECLLKGSLAFTGKGHATDKAVLLGLHGYLPNQLCKIDIDDLITQLKSKNEICIAGNSIRFEFKTNILFDFQETLDEHPNGMVFKLIDKHKKTGLTETYFSIGGGFIQTQDDIKQITAPLQMQESDDFPFGFDSADEMIEMADKNGFSIAQLKTNNECSLISLEELNKGLDETWEVMKSCVESGLNGHGILPGGLLVERRAHQLHQQMLQNPKNKTVNDWLCAYAMAVNEENAAGHVVVTAPTNGAAGVVPAVIYYAVKHQDINQQQIRDFLLTAAAIGGLIKHNSSISGAEVGCQGEVGSAAAMAAAGLCAIYGGTVYQVENAAEIALEHHLGLTCDPVKGLVQIPCIERNGFGAIKAFTASSLALHGTGTHLMSLDRCIRAMKRTGQEMSYKYKETSLGGLAVSQTEC